MPVTPMPGYCLLEPYTEPDQTKAGVYVPDEAKDERLPLGKVIETGGNAKLENYYYLGHELHACPCNIGDIVAYTPYSDTTVKWQGEEYKLIRFDKIVAVVESAPEATDVQGA